MLVKEFLEVFASYSDVHVIIDLHCNTYAVALTDAKTAGKHNVVGKLMLIYCFLQELNYLLRALDMAGASYTDLYYEHDQSFARTSFLKKSPTLSGVTEWKASFTVTQTPA